jgi:cobalamin biosynthetic protein CobC
VVTSRVGRPAIVADDGEAATRPPGREHGGGLDAAALRYGIASERWLDLSTGINPWPYPLPDLPPALWQRLPDATLMATLCRAAAACWGVSDPARVVAAPGSQTLIQWLPRLMRRSLVVVVGPTYNEHAAAWAAAGHDVCEVATLDAVPDLARVCVVVNPNNPDGRTVAPAALAALAARCRVIVDEAFADVQPAVSVTGLVEAGDLVVLRSAGKFFGLAGLRLGFAVAAPATAAALAEALGPWAVSGPAAFVGARALADRAWMAATRRRLADAAGRLDAMLAGHGLRVVGGTDLFRLVADERAPALVEALARQGVLTRHFARQPTWLRFGLPGPAAAERRLAAALAAAVRPGT